MGRMLWSDRARRGIRSGRDEDPCRKSLGWLPADRLENVDLELSHRGCRSSSGRSRRATTIRFAGLSSRRGWRAFQHRRSRASSRFVPRLQRRSSWTAWWFLNARFCPTSPVSRGLSAVSTGRATASRGVRWGCGRLAFTCEAIRPLTANSSTGRSRPLNWCRRNSPICKLKLR